MTSDLAIATPQLTSTPAGVLQSVLIDSRQRWRELVNLTADFAFEADEWGRFSFITPDFALHWAAGELVGQPSAMLLVDGGGAVFDPFRVTAKVRQREAWVKRGDGTTVCLTFSAAPILDQNLRIIGTRGVGIDLTDRDVPAAKAAATLRRATLMDHILRRMGQEVRIPRMMTAILDVVANAVGAEGAAVMVVPPDTVAVRLSHVVGSGSDSIVEAAGDQLRLGERRTGQTMTEDGRKLLMAGCRTRFGDKGGLVVWRAADARAWDDDDSQLIASAVNIIRMVLDHEASQDEMLRQARTDPLTGLLNRRAFFEEIERRAARQERDNQPGTLVFADLDNFKPVNDRLGHEAGDEVLRRTADLLRKTFRPTDLIARLGGDEFAIWLDGADHMTAAERAEFLRDAVPRDLAETTGPDLPLVTISIGIATRDPTDQEPLDNLMRRADMAMYQVKRGGRGHWRVSLRKRT
jgi:diguanylate cyclase (GGDEF)-like protein